MPCAFDRPGTDEHADFYAPYLALVPEGDLLAHLRLQLDELDALLGALPDSVGDAAYAPGKWTLKEVVGHCIDAERVYAYRALVMARGDQTSLPGFDEDAWVPPAGFGDRSLRHLLDEWRTVRAASVSLLEGLPAGADLRRGTANGKPFSVRAIARMLYGHAAHHRRVMREKYLAS